MNKRYIDFVPKAKQAGAAGANARVAQPRTAAKAPAVKPRMTAKPRMVAKAPAAKAVRPVRQEEVQLEEIFAEKPAEKGVKKFGVIEDFSGKFVSKEVEKRPLSKAQMDAAEAKAKKISRISLLGKGRNKAMKATEDEAKGADKASKSNKAQKTEKKTEVTPPKMKIPERPFVNIDKVEKRPLSRNVYQPRKVVVAPKEEPQGPVTIIEKPEKDSRIGLIVTIIITIILGAAAGTVAFLLLPK